jgi:hypothetical protein
VRALLLIILLLGLFGSAIELILLGHYDEWKQWIPLGLLAAAIALLAAYGVTRSTRVLRAFRWLAVGFVFAGLLGIFFHYRGNVEFEREMYPQMKGLELIWEALRGATPALAPGTMVQLGLVALAYLYGHPQLTRTAQGETTE